MKVLVRGVKIEIHIKNGIKIFNLYSINKINMEKKVLTPEEITLEMERRKNIRRQRLEEKIIRLTEKCDREDVIYVFSSLISRITK